MEVKYLLSCVTTPLALKYTDKAGFLLLALFYLVVFFWHIKDYLPHICSFKVLSLVDGFTLKIEKNMPLVISLPIEKHEYLGDFLTMGKQCTEVT